MRVFTWALFTGVVALVGCGRGSSAEASSAAVPYAAVGPGHDAGRSSGKPAVPDVGSSCGTCTAYGTPSVAGNVPAPLVELSGLAASHRNPGVIYMHNDSGDTARFFAMNATAAALGEFQVQGASAVDWEDIAVGPCPAGSCVYLGDIGDNAEKRKEYAVYRVAEPDVAAGTPAGTMTVTSERLPFVYPDGPHNAETLLANPLTGDLYVITKVLGDQSKVYRFPTPFAPGRTATLTPIGDLALDASEGPVTGGDVHPCGNRLLVRTYIGLFEFVTAPASPFEALFSATPTEVPAASEPQGEAVAYRIDGKGYFTASEKAHGANVPLHAVGCR